MQENSTYLYIFKLRGLDTQMMQNKGILEVVPAIPAL